MIRVLYIACSSYSGSTLLSFLLNCHPEMFTIGHLMGWSFDDDEEFHCSCGAPIQECPFFRHVERAFGDAELPFKFNSFGTRYRLAGSDRLNRYLTASIPYCDSSRIETFRDNLVRRVGRWSSRFERQNRANYTLIKAGIEYSGARVFVENSQTPFRLRHLARIDGLEIRTVHLVRDFRGVALSHMKRRAWGPALAARKWFDEQAKIARILPEIGAHMTVHYEDLCENTDRTLAAIHRFAGLDPSPFTGDFKEAEHHILGNQMRLSNSKISTDQRWRTELTESQRTVIEQTIQSLLPRGNGHPLVEIVSNNLSRPAPDNL